MKSQEHVIVASNEICVKDRMYYGMYDTPEQHHVYRMRSRHNSK